MANSKTAVSDSTVKNQLQLNYYQKQRYDYLLPVYGDKTAELVMLIEGRGKNSWAHINDKIQALNDAKFAEQAYHDALYENFIEGTIHSSQDIIGIVADVRRDMGLPPYITRLRNNCENDFFNLFIVQDVYEDYAEESVMKRRLVGYNPVFKLKIED